jgi:hypothetical protein
MQHGGERSSSNSMIEERTNLESTGKPNEKQERCGWWDSRITEELWNIQRKNQANLK